MFKTFSTNLDKILSTSYPQNIPQLKLLKNKAKIYFSTFSTD